MAPLSSSTSVNNQQSMSDDSTTTTMNPLRKLRIVGRFFRAIKNGRSSATVTSTTVTTQALGPNLTTPAGSKSSNHQRWTTLATLICLVVLFLYIATNSWPPLFTSLDRQHRILFEKLEHGHRATGAIHGASSSSSSKRLLMPTILARPMKHTPESLKLIGINHLTEIIKTNLSQIGNTTISQMNERIVNTAPNCTQGAAWQSHRYESHQTRLKRLRWMCSVYGFYDRIFTYWNRSSNRRFGDRIEHKYCSTLHCPLLVDDQRRVITCFVQKVASTTIKQLFLKLVNQTNDTDNDKEKATQHGHQSTTVHNLTTFHQTANEQLFRVSPMYIHNVKNSHYFKSLFVRHPFVRLVSAFKDKAERGPNKEPYFYAKYWYPLMDRLNPSSTTNQTARDPASRITFRQFVDELLLKTDPYHYDEHWAPIWTRCEPCYMHYNFIGKLETSDNDFAMFKSRLDQSLINETVWENQNINFSNGTSESKSSNWNQEEELATDQKQCQLTRMRYAETSRYLAQLDPKSIIELYRRYYLDFELFGYTLEELFDTGYY